MYSMLFHNLSCMTPAEHVQNGYASKFQKHPEAWNKEFMFSSAPCSLDFSLRFFPIVNWNGQTLDAKLLTRQQVGHRVHEILMYTL